MSRKRRLKKRRKRRAQWVGALEDLYLRRDDEAFLEAARPHLRELDAVAMTAPYGEVAGRVLAGVLTGGDPARVGALLTRIRRDAAPRPLVLLAEAVDLLAQGRRETAVARLDALGAAGETELDAARRLPERLRALARCEDVPAPERRAAGAAPWREIETFARLTRTLEAHAVSGSKLPRTLALADPAARATWAFYRALSAVAARRFRPGDKTLATLTRSAKTLRESVPVDGALERLLRETEKRVRALTILRAIEQTARRRRGDGVEVLVLDRLSGDGALATRLLRDQPPALLRPLQHALRTRWRRLLELVAERGGAAGLATLLAAHPETSAAELDPGAEVAAVRRWAEARSLRESERFGALARFLRSAAARVTDPRELATLWSLELWARREEDAREGENEVLHKALRRVLEMTGALRARFDVAERPQMARFLRAELFALYDALPVCDDFRAAAEALLAWIEDDSGLLVVALAGAVESRDDRAAQTYAARLAAPGPARADRETLLRLAENVAAEWPRIAVPVLTALRSPMGDGWAELLERVTPAAVAGMRIGLREARRFKLMDPDGAEEIMATLRRHLENFRPLLGEMPMFEALELEISRWNDRQMDLF